jgi:hypothetical protein
VRREYHIQNSPIDGLQMNSCNPSFAQLRTKIGGRCLALTRTNQ